MVSAPEGVCWFVFASQVVFLYGMDLGYETPYSGPSASEDHPWPGFLVYAYAFFLSFSAVVNLPPYQRDVTADIRAAFYRTVDVQAFAAIALSFTLLLPLVLVKSEILLFNHQYLLIGSTKSFIVAQSANTIVDGLCVLSLLTLAAMFALNVTFNRPLLAAMILPALIWGVVYMLCRCSRFGAMPFVLMALIFFSIGGRRGKAAAIGLVAIAIFLLGCALNGRGNGIFGLLALPSILESGLESSKVSWATILLNVFQGAFITADGLDIRASYPTIYKILSFSITPSFLDGYTGLKARFEVRLNRYTPMSALVEIVHFGMPYVVLASCMWWGALRYLTAKAARFGATYIFLVAIYVLMFVQACTYNLRGTFRTLAVATVLALVVTGRNARGERASR